MKSKIYDAVIIGGGPAGLSAAIYLARFNRSVIILDKEEGRSTTPGKYRNIMGFFDPIERKDLRRFGLDQAEKYGAEKVYGKAIEIIRSNDGSFRVITATDEYVGKNVIFCTGITDNFPEVEGYQQYLGHSFHSCTLCAGYECLGKRIIGIGSGAKMLRFALSMLIYTDEISIVTNGYPIDIEAEGLAKLQRKDIPVYTNKIIKLVGNGNQVEKLVIDNYKELDVDVVFAEMGFRVNASLPLQLSLEVNEEGEIIVNSQQETNVSGIYAAGDVTSFDSKQVVTSTYEGFAAALAIHNKLLDEEIENI